MYKASLLTLSALLATPALGDAMPGAPPRDAFAPLPAGVTPICTDRPTKANFACTVPDGQIQIEADGVNWSHLSQAGTTTDIVLYTNPTLKLGVTGSTDIEVNWAPYASVHISGAGTQYSAGDVVLRLKQRLTAADAKVSIAILPFVKAPIAKWGMGNRQWEGGVVLPVNVALPKDFTLTLAPELDVMADCMALAKRHTQFQQAVNLSKALTPAVTIYGELWTAQNFDPAIRTSQYSADFAVAWLARKTLQFDVGGNFGLNRATPAAQLYVGVSARF